MKYFLILLFLYSSSSFAVSFSAQKIMRAAPTSTGAQVSVMYAGQKAANQAVYAVRSVPVTKQVIANVIRTRSFNPWGVAVVAAVTAAAYYIDTDTGQITSGQTVDPFIGKCYSNGTTLNGVSGTACLAFADSKYPTQSMYYDASSPSSYENSTYKVYGITGSLGSDAGSFTVTKQAGVVYPVEPVVLPSVVTDTQLFDDVVPLLSTQQFQELFEDPLTGKPNPDIQIFNDVRVDIDNDYLYQNDGDPNTNPTVDLATGDTGTDSLSDEKPEDKDPCIRNPNLLACMESGDMQDSVPIPTQAVSFSIVQYSLTGNASCPADIPLPKGMSYSFQPICTAATMLNPVIIASSFLAALLIVTGAGRREA